MRSSIARATQIFQREHLPLVSGLRAGLGQTSAYPVPGELLALELFTATLMSGQRLTRQISILLDSVTSQHSLL